MPLDILNKDEVVRLEGTVPFRNEDVDRQSRWAHMLSDYEAKDPDTGRMIKVEGDLSHDPVLMQRQVSPQEQMYRRFSTEMLMDNVKREAMTSIAKRKGAGMLGEATITTGDVAAFTTWSLPLVRKIWPRLFAHEIVGVRPMSQPTGRVYSLDFQYASSGGVYASGTSVYANEDADYSDDQGEATEPRKLKLAVTGATVTATAKKLITDWSIEVAQDLNAYHGLALEPEMMNIMGMQIEREKNREILDGVVAAATTNTNWSSSQGVSPDPWSNATPRQFAESLWDSIMDANRQIYDRVYEDGNVMVCGSTFANRLTKLNSFRLLDGAAAGDAQVVTGPNLFGSLSGNIRVFKDPYFTADKAVLVHKSPDWLRVGYVHLNYVPIWVSPTIPETDFTFAKGIMSRYANYEKNGDFFATITVT
jgi:hypothetical protein